MRHIVLVLLAAFACTLAVSEGKKHAADDLPGWQGEKGQFSAKAFVDAALKNPAVVFSKSYCPYCRKAKATLKQILGADNLTIIELDQMEQGREVQGYLGELTGASTVPRIFFGGEFYGGGDYTGAQAASGNLQKHLRSLGIHAA